ncbi:MAG: hypothetical protein WB812_02760, partial [Woeseiaceae bacterium]
MCFERAFPRSQAAFRDARGQLDGFAQRLRGLPPALRRRLDDTGIAGTAIHYPFSYDVARWLARRVPGRVSIDW